MILKDICQVDWGNTELTKSSYIDDGTFLAVSAAGCDGRINHFEHEANVSVLSAIGAQCGKMFFPNAKFTAIKNTITLTPKDGALGKYIYYLFTAIELPKRGAGQPFISKGDIEKFQIPPIPSLATQEKIVKKLDEVFSEIDKTISIAELNVKNSEAIFQSYLTKIFEQESEEWKSHSIKELGKVVTGNTPKTNEKDNYGDFISFVKPGDFNSDGTIDYEKQKLSLVGMGKSRVIDENSVLMVCIGATIGKCGYTDKKIVTNQQINSLTPTSNFNHKFIYFQMLSNEFQNSVMEASGQATLPIINKSKWESLSLKCPPLEQQNSIVVIFDNLRTETDIFKNCLVNKIKELLSLKQVILKETFNAELVKD